MKPTTVKKKPELRSFDQNKFDKMKAMIFGGASCQEIAMKMNMSRETIDRYLIASTEAFELKLKMLENGIKNRRAAMRQFTKRRKVEIKKEKT